MRAARSAGPTRHRAGDPARPDLGAEAARLLRVITAVRQAADADAATIILADALSQLPGVAEVAVSSDCVPAPAGWAAFPIDPEAAAPGTPVRAANDQTAMAAAGGTAAASGTVLLAIDRPLLVAPLYDMIAAFVAGFAADRLERQARGTIEDRAARLEADLAAEREDRARLLTDLGHELRPPTNAILGFSDVMHRALFGPIDNPRYRRYIAHLQGSAVRLAALIGDIFDLAAMQDGTFRLRDSAVDMPRVIDDTLKMFSGPISEKQLTIDRSITLDRVHADRRALKQVLATLIGNAVKFTRHGDRIGVSARVDPVTRAPRICITDTGPGIDPDILATLVAPMPADPVTVRPDSRVGLGLPLACALVRRHGGDLTVRSATAVGTTVCIILPPTRNLELEDPPSPP